MAFQKRHIKSFFSALLSKLNLNISWSTDPDDLKLLINRLKPIAYEKELIRMGSNHDGGYLIPNDLDDIQAVFSPGVSDNADFEADCAKLGMKVFLADASVESSPIINKNFHFTKKYIGVTTNHNFMTLDDWVNLSLENKESDLLLQIDIEGFEYEAFLGMSDNLMKRFRIIVAEFHDLDQLLNSPFFKISSRAFEKITQTHYCVHIHPNNQNGLLKIADIEIPRVAEFTFIRKDRVKSFTLPKEYPHPLDRDNVTGKTLNLPKCWYG